MIDGKVDSLDLGADFEVSEELKPIGSSSKSAVL